jgi:hypothetical protein
MGLVSIAGYAKIYNPDNYDDDEVKATMEEVGVAMAGVSIPLIITLTVIRFLLNGAGIWGAVKYNQYAVGASLFAYGAEFILSLVHFNVSGLILNGFFAYPHVFLIKEIRSGIMTPETYQVEKQSCCCV